MTPDLTIIERVEKLLAKAESTTFEEERNAYVTKAQELMTRHAIEEAMLRQSDGSKPEITSVRFDVDSMKYSRGRAKLVDAIANANNCYRIAWPKEGNKRGFGIIEVYGTRSALELVEVLWHSLNAQLDKALAETPVPSHVQGKTFRNNFVRAYAYAIAVRLRDAKEETLRSETSSSVALVLVNEREQAESYAKDLASSNGMRVTSQVDKYRGNDEGWSQGKEAGNNASLSRGELN